MALSQLQRQKEDQRRKQLAAQPPGLTLREIAKRLGMSPESARNRAIAYGYSYRSLNPRIESTYAGVDWQKSDIAIAKQLGRTRQAVHVARRRLGMRRGEDL